MSKSKALRKREKLIREGRLNPEINRSPFAKLDLRTRKTKTKKGSSIPCKTQEPSSKTVGRRFFLFYNIRCIKIRKNIAIPLYKWKYRSLIVGL